jgi:hypothetical protein
MTHTLVEEDDENVEIKVNPGDSHESQLHRPNPADAFLPIESTFDWMDHALPFALNDGDLFLS